MKNPRKRIGLVLFLAVSVFWLWRIHLGLFHDEIQDINFGKLLVEGDSFVQFTGIGLSHYALFPLMFLYHRLVGSYDGVFLFLRIWFSIGQILVSAYMYTTCRLFWNEKQATAAALLTCFFIFNYIAITYKAALFWGTILVILFLLRRVHTGKTGYVVLAAITLSLTVLSFPSSAILLIPATTFLVRHDQSPRQSVIILWAGCGICAALFCLDIFTRYSFSDVEKAYFQSTYFQNRGALPALRKMVIVAVLYGASEVGLWLWKTGRLPVLGKKDVWTILNAGFWILLAGLILAKPRSAQDSRFWYAYLMLALTLLAMKRQGFLRASNQGPIDLFFDMALFSYMAISLSSNQGIAIVAHGAIYALIGGSIALLEDRSDGQKSSMRLAGSILLSMVVCAVVFINDENEMIASSNVFQERTRICEGPGKGIYVTAYTHDIYDSIYLTAKKYARKDDRMLIVADYYRAIGTIGADVVEAIPCSFFMEQFLATDLAESYCDRFPDRSPTLILVDTSYTGDFETWIESVFFKRYLEAHFDLENPVRDGQWVILSQLPEKTQ